MKIDSGTKKGCSQHNLRLILMIAGCPVKAAGRNPNGPEFPAYYMKYCHGYLGRSSTPPNPYNIASHPQEIAYIQRLNLAEREERDRRAAAAYFHQTGEHTIKNRLGPKDMVRTHS